MIEKVFEIMDKEVLTQADMAYVATFNFYPYIDEEITLDGYYALEEDLMQFIYDSCEEWSDYDDEYPDNTYDWGYIVNGQRLTFGHHGRAGEYWNRDGNLSIAY